MVDLPKLKGVLNFRDLGGIPVEGDARVRPGRILRSGHLGDATDDDIDALARLGIKTVVDFRTTADRGVESADRMPAGAEHVALPMPDPSGRGAELRVMLHAGDTDGLRAAFGEGRAFAFARDGVVSMATNPEQTATYRAFVDVATDPDRHPVLFHCSAGKDRAGWAATVLLMALGADDDHIETHYLASNVFRDPEKRLAVYASFGVEPEVIRPLVELHPDYVRAGLRAVEDHWGGRRSYLRDGLGLDGARISAFRRLMIE